MQHHVSQRLKKYLLLIRLPNVFTTPSNILAGYFAAAFTVAKADGAHLTALMVSSGLLYIAGIVLNDYFDIEIDKRERPSRPLPSGKISKGHALAIAIVALLIANAIALVVGPASLAVSLALTLAIIAYDYQLKHGAVGPFAMGATRFLNVIFGASPVLLYINNHSLAIVGTAAASLFLYISSITILSKKEAENEKPNSATVFLLVFGVILAVAGLGLLLLQMQWTFLLNLSLFAAVMIVTFKGYLTKDSSSSSVQKAVRNMVISIIILDSVFVTGTAGLEYGIATLLLIAPAIVLARKLYVT
ncbi:MAG: UbiA family prenyltransferase [Thermoproteota archaeon]|nr:UbiA family prenyltransferase [Thermoproteota archaeon]